MSTAQAEAPLPAEAERLLSQLEVYEAEVLKTPKEQLKTALGKAAELLHAQM